MRGSFGTMSNANMLFCGILWNGNFDRHLAHTIILKIDPFAVNYRLYLLFSSWVTQDYTKCRNMIHWSQTESLCQVIEENMVCTLYTIR